MGGEREERRKGEGEGRDKKKGKGEREREKQRKKGRRGYQEAGQGWVGDTREADLPGAGFLPGSPSPLPLCRC